MGWIRADLHPDDYQRVKARLHAEIAAMKQLPEHEGLREDQRNALALRSMYRTCAVGGCERSFDRCEMHHIVEWLHLGDTDLDNLLPLCLYHHHRVHEGRWRVELDPSTRQLDVHLPDGTLHSRSLPDIVSERPRENAA